MVPKLKKLKIIKLSQKGMIFKLYQKPRKKIDAVIGWSDNLRTKDLLFKNPVHLNCIVSAGTLRIPYHDFDTVLRLSTVFLK
jgi:hypothetical protein